MFKAICGLIFAVVVRILIEYLSRQFSFLADWVPTFNWICIGVGIAVGLFIVIRIVMAIVNLAKENRKGSEK